MKLRARSRIYLQIVKRLRVYLLLQLLQPLSQCLQVGWVYFVLDAVQNVWHEHLLEVLFQHLQLAQVAGEGTLDFMLQTRYLGLSVGLPVLESLLEAGVVLSDGPGDLLDFPVSFGLDLLHLDHEGQVVERIGIVGDALAEFVASNLEVVHDVGGSDEDQQVEDQAEDEDGGEEVGPDVDAFVVDHEKASEYFGW